jgi:hypothetical protein
MCGGAGSLENATGAVGAAAAARGDAAVELEFVEAGAPAMSVALDVSVGNALADANNHLDHSRARLRPDGSNYK